jgi:hypothetical protein
MNDGPPEDRAGKHQGDEAIELGSVEHFGS